jgi:hypothetical protein
MEQPQQHKKTIQINPEFLKFPTKGGNRTRKVKDPKEPKPIKIKVAEQDKTIRRRALNFLRKKQAERYKRLLNGEEADDNAPTKPHEELTGVEESIEFLKKLAERNNSTIKRPPPVLTNSMLFQTPVLNEVLSEGISLVEPDVFRSDLPKIAIPPPPAYGCLKNGKFPTYRTYKNQGGGSPSLSAVIPTVVSSYEESKSSSTTTESPVVGGARKMTPEQQRAELKQFLKKKSDEKQRVEQVKRQKQITNPKKKQRRITTRTYRVGKSKHYPRVGVLIPNKTIREQILAKKQNIREAQIEEIRKYLIKKGLIRVGSTCPNDVLRKMYESSMLMCGEIQNHNPDNLLFNYLNNAL